MADPVQAGRQLTGARGTGPWWTSARLPRQVQPAQPRVAVLGAGRLHAAVVTALEQACTPVPLPAAAEGLTAAKGPAARGGCSALVVVTDSADTALHPQIAHHAGANRMPWLPVHVDSGWVLTGPAVRPAVPGCPQCVARRRRGNRSDALGRDALRARFGSELATRPCGLLTRLVTTAVGRLVAAEVDNLLHAPDRALTSGALLRIAVTTGEVRRHRFLADPLCPTCGARPSDGPAAAGPPRGPAPKPAPAVFRVGSLASRAGGLEHSYVDPETGFVQSVVSTVRRGGSTAVARLSPAHSADDSQHGYGRGDDVPTARATAVVEALERVSGRQPRDRRTAVYAAYADIADHAIDPRALGLHPDDRYDLPGFRPTRYTPDRRMAWVWGYSFARDEPLLVPESCAYFGPRPDGDPGFVHEGSNGCAIGANPVEAVLYGLLEVAERDAALAAWYARIPLPRVDLASAADPHVPMMAERIRHLLGYEVTALVAGVEQGLPVSWVMAVDPDDDPQRPKAVCGTAADLNPERGLRRALEELGPVLEGQIQRYDPAHAARLAADSGLVRRQSDHPTRAGHRDAFGRMDFLTADGRVLDMAEVTRRLAWPTHDDLGADLAELVGRYLATGLDVISVDITSPEAAVEGFCCAKVIVPGTLPMTFGHRYQRTHGLPRVLSLPRLLGQRPADLRPDQLNPYPHPLP